MPNNQSWLRDTPPDVVVVDVVVGDVVVVVGVDKCVMLRMAMKMAERHIT